MAKVKVGEDVRLCGNIPAFGCDDPNLAVPLVTSPSTYPWWKTKEPLYLPGTKIKYRYCIFSGGKFNRWEGGEKEIIRELDTIGVDASVNEINDILDVTPDEAKKVFSNTEMMKIMKPLSPTRSNGSNITTGGTTTTARSFKSRQFTEWSKRVQNDQFLSQSDGVIIVSYFLPVTLSKHSDGKWSAAWDSENLLALSLDARVSWVGSIRYQGAPIPQDDEEAVSRVLSELNCYPIFINAAMHYQFYDIFCKQNLWLLLHQIADVYGPLNHSDIGAKGQQDLWFTYSTINRIFRDKVVEVFHQGDHVWIHGFHLMLLPSFLRRFLQLAKIGYFFHTPFPSSEIWRTITRREDLLRGILCADQIGFHLYEYARHFLTCCHRVLGCGSEMNSSGTLVVNIDGREVAVTCIHTGVDLPKIKVAYGTDKFAIEMKSWREKFPNKIVVAGIDRLERLKGIPLKLAAIDEFLEENRKYIGRIVFTIIGITALERGDDYRQTLCDVTTQIKKINTKYNDLIVYFEERKDSDIRIAQRLAYFAGSDILMITATRDGLNRYPMEYTLAKQKAGEILGVDYPVALGEECVGQSMIIMSEFISSSRVMRGALTVNPWRLEEVKAALLLALEMNKSERFDRTRRNLEFSTRLTTTNWATQVLHDLKCVTKNDDPTENFAVGFGMGYRVMGVKAGFQPLDVGALGKSYRQANHRLLVFDWGGTLVAENDKSDKLQAYALAKGHGSRTGPTKALKDALELLCLDPRNIVFVVSGKEVKAVSSFFGDVKGLGLGAEHGFYYKWPNSETDGLRLNVFDKDAKSRWQTVQSLGDQSWKEAALMVMDIYTKRTHGAYIEQKGSALIWQFRDADPEFGFMQSKELEENLRGVLSSFPVEVLRGGGVSDGYIEVRQAGVSKGLFIEHALATLTSLEKEPSFILAIGDDASDEPMFDALNRINDIKENISIFGVSVGKKPTSATSYVDDPAAVMEVLETLIKSTQRDKRFFSSIDLPSQAAPLITTPVRSSLDSSAHGRELGGGRALSVGNLVSRDTSTESDIVRPSKGRNPWELKQGPTSTTKDINNLTRSTSYLSMNHYLDNIDDKNAEGEDDCGIFF